MSLALAISRRFKSGPELPFRASIRHSTFQIRLSSAPLSPQTPSHPVPAPRPGPTRPSTLKSNFLSAIGARFKQDVVYYVSSSTLFVGHCDHRRNLTPITRFSNRVDS